MTEDPDSSGITIDLAVQAPGWGGERGALALAARRATEFALRIAPEAAALPKPLEVSLLLADDAAVRVLNRDYRGQDKATNVLSFAQWDDDAGVPAEPGTPLLLGDVVLAKETLEREAVEARKTVGDHVSHLAVHGVLHLLGYRHDRDRDARRMEALEVEILAALGIADPYAPGDAEAVQDSGIILGSTT